MDKCVKKRQFSQSWAILASKSLWGFLGFVSSCCLYLRNLVFFLVAGSLKNILLTKLDDFAFASFDPTLPCFEFLLIFGKSQSLQHIKNMQSFHKLCCKCHWKLAKLAETESLFTINVFQSGSPGFYQRVFKEAKMFTVISIDMYEARVLSRKKTMKVKSIGFLLLDDDW